MLRSTAPLAIQDVGDVHLIIYPDRAEAAVPSVQEITEIVSTQNRSIVCSGKQRIEPLNLSQLSIFVGVLTDTVHMRYSLLMRKAIIELQNEDNNQWVYMLMKHDYEKALIFAFDEHATDVVRRCIASDQFLKGDYRGAASTWAGTSASPERVLSKLLSLTQNSLISTQGSQD